MARKPRIHLPDGLYHVILQGRKEAPVFFSDRDRLHFESLTAEGIERFGHRIHGYFWDDRTVELAIQIRTIPLAKVIQHLTFRYASWFNRRERSQGPVFQGRYKAVPVDADAGLAGLVRHIHLAPVRAGLAADPADYPWSGHRAYIGLTATPWLTTDRLLTQLDPDPEIARKRYGEFVNAGIGKGFRKSSRIGSTAVPEDKRFAARAAEQADPVPAPLVNLASIFIAVSVARGLDIEELRSPGRGRRAADARALAAYLVSETGAATLTQTARLLNRDVTTLSNAATGVRERIAEDTEFAAEVRRLLSILYLGSEIKA